MDGYRKTLCLLSLLMVIGASRANAQISSESDGDNFDQIEAEIGKGSQKDNALSDSDTAKTTSAAKDSGRKNGTDGNDFGRLSESGGYQPLELKKISDLNSLAPFSEVSIIQRKYLPKTGRFQIYGGGAILANDPWYYGLGGGARFGYHFTESWGVEGNFFGLSSSEKSSATDLKSNNGINTDSIVNTKSYLGLDVVWYPIYGKISLSNRRIVHFDMYFAGGAGQSTIGGSDKNSVPTYHLGTGQLFAVTKSVGFRWDFSWNYYTATQYDKLSGASSTGNFSNLILTLGISFLFPEATYR